MSKRNRLVAIFALLLAAVALYVFRDRIRFDWAVFFHQLRFVDPWHLLLGVAIIHAHFWLRAWRWKIFLYPARDVKASRLVGPMFVGFTAASLFGRLADLTRPYLLAKRVDLPVSTQVAVYTVERMFDLGAAAIVFSSALALAPAGLPHRERYVHVGVLSLAATLAIALFAVFLRIAGARVAGVAGGLAGKISVRAGAAVEEKILGFRDGLNAIASVREFVAVLAISVAIWTMIAATYVQVVHAFTHTPELAGLSFARTMLLFAASLGGSLLQLPIVGWFTQIAVTAASMREFYGAPVEAATACGALLFLVTTLSIVPTGFVFARLESVSVRGAVDESGGKAS
ncbi:hypothetical protein SAMN05421770_106124 [Granulicella rosea]|uniref:Lysylphosphatidylglycerol synthase TM region n=1 Tax=Granulicella rosea TaxID=474952 RepID=A0A239L6Q2_9BACT|nr:lysylphosphatidylglycerol synthase transmembrane domain-containing protein [Granulicella rosea]SNT25692.1 hypothetical protein SAMN05421770_106124 [Granulicella rosea]